MASKEQQILIVDGNRNLADLYTTWLSNSYNVKTVYSGSEALNQLDNTIDIVLLDRRMPEMPGEEVLAEIQERDLDCCVALVTSVEPDFDILDLGFDAYLEKSVTRENLHQLVETLSNRLQYNDSLQEYYALQSKQSSLQAQKDPKNSTNMLSLNICQNRLTNLNRNCNKYVKSSLHRIIAPSFMK